MSYRWKTSTALFSLMLILPSMAAQAQTVGEPDGAVEADTDPVPPAPYTAGSAPIIVTAQRRAQNIQDVPISITAFSEAELEARSANDVADAIAFAPNVASTAGPNGGDDGGFFIRGVGQLDNSIAVDPGVGVYIDEVYIARLQASSIDLLDIERIEVLRGPQGTLFGRNTIGGAVSVVTQTPSFDEVSGRVRLIYGARDRVEAAGSINLPISGNAAVRASLFTRHQDGFGENVYTGDTFGDVEDYGGRLKFRIQPGDRLDINLSADYLIGRGSPSHQVLRAYNPRAGITVPLPPPAGPTFIPGVSPTGVPLPAGVGEDRSSDRSLNFASVPAENDIDNGGVSLNVRAELSDNLLLRSITAWRSYEEQTFNDFDATGFVLYDTFNEIDQEQFSQELQLAGEISDAVEFLLGAYYFEEEVYNRIELCTGSNAPRLVERCLQSLNDIWLDVESFAVFGQASYSVTDSLEVFAGARWTEETKRQSFESILDNTDGVPTRLPPFVMPPPGQIRVALPFTTVEDTFDAFTPKFGVNWEVTPDLNVYASFSQGFKSGGFTGRPSNAQIDPYDPETVDSYELGFKSNLFGDDLRISGAVFHSDYSDIQLLVFTPISGLFETRNAGDAEIRGFELEANGRIGDRFTFYTGIGHLDAGYTSLSPQVANITLDTPLPLTPSWTYAVGTEYRQPLGQTAGELRLRADFNYRDDVSFQLEADPLEVQGGYSILNLRATWVSPNRNFDVAVFGTNVTDEEYFTNAQDTLAGNGTAFAGVGDPAEWGIEVNLRF
jgi:iron complex outermembrane receptor protein